jgi:hypothetical protein
MSNKINMDHFNHEEYNDLLEFKEKIKNFENPDEIKIDSKVDPKFRDYLYDKIKRMKRTEILELFEN